MLKTKMMNIRELQAQIEDKHMHTNTLDELLQIRQGEIVSKIKSKHQVELEAKRMR